MGLESYPFFFVLIAMGAYAAAYWGYGKWFDRNIWKPDSKRTTPAHMYMDGVEYFPVGRYVLWGYQFKSVAALGPILGPFIGITFGWLPAFLWIIFGNFFIGWVQDYGAIMLSVRKEGRSFGPITYEFTGEAGRKNLLAFVLFYLIIISAVFIFLVAAFWNTYPGTFVATIALFATGVLCGQLLYRWKVNVFIVTAIGLILTVVSVWLGVLIPIKLPFGAWNVAVWAIGALIILYLGSILPMPTFIQPTNYISFFPAYAAIILILLGALVSPLTDVTLKLPTFTGFYDPVIGPLWPILFVAIACGAISGWHSLVGSSSTAKQLDIETDAHPVGAGAMLSEGLLALASLAAYMVLAPAIVLDPARANFASWVLGAVALTQPFLGGTGAVAVLTTFFGLVLVIYALTVQALVTRFFRLVAAESVGEGRLRILGNKHVATGIGLLIPYVFAITGSWWALWLYFGGANQLLAGLAIMLITIHLAKTRAPSMYTLIPATFMIITTLAALLWEAWLFFRAIVNYYFLAVPGVLEVREPIRSQYTLLAVGLNAVFVFIGGLLFLVGLSMAIRLYRSYFRSRAEVRAAPAAAPGGGGGQ